jgi:hypothetical protein
LSHHHSKPAPGFVMARPVTVVSSLLILSGAGEVQAAGLAAVQAEARLCLQGGQPAACERALDQTEQLQRRAADLEAYPCQTLLLAVQADVILQQLGKGRGEGALADLSAAGRGCVGL